MALDFVKFIERFIKDHSLIDDTDTVIVGLSGGADSVALLNVLQELQCRMIATHCNFHLRGSESMRDENFCREICARAGVDLIVKDFDVDSRCKEFGESVEMACRALRYNWWESLINVGMGTIVAVGHHEDDNIETLFLNLLRGSSLAGLKGMLPKNGNVIRPLLDRSRHEIVSYLDAKGADYITDSSNADNSYKRNRLRNVIIPLIEKEFPGAKNSIGDTQRHLRDNYRLYLDYKAILKRKYVADNGEIDLSELIASESNARNVLYELISEQGFTMSQVEDLLSVANVEKCKPTLSGQQFVGRELIYVLSRGRLVPMTTVSDKNEIRIIGLSESPFSLRILSPDEFKTIQRAKQFNPNVLYADEKIITDGATFYIRKWEIGDRIKPFGMKGSKLLSDIFSDLKLSVAEKAEIDIVIRNDEIIWIPGIRCSSLYPVTEKTQRVIEITYNKSDNLS